VYDKFLKPQQSFLITLYNIISVIFIQVDEAVVKTVVSVLTAEEQALGLQQPSATGQRPHPMTIHHNQTVEGCLMP
jgi:hypothetical protein